jgi:DNA-directed RNA polymerase subunit L
MILNYFAIQSFDREHTWCKLFQKRIERIKYDIHVFICIYRNKIPIKDFNQLTFQFCWELAYQVKIVLETVERNTIYKFDIFLDHI